MCRHGAPKIFATDPEFCKESMKIFLSRLGTILEERPSRSSHKNGILERNNGKFKGVLDPLAKEMTDASPATIVARASFFANRFKESSILSAFQQARVYSPSVAGIPPAIV